MLKRLTLVLFISSCLFSQTLEGIPDWYYNPPRTEGILYAGGSGDGRMESILNCLSSLELQVFDPPINFIKKLSDGKFTLESRFVSFSKEIGKENDIEIFEQIESTKTLLYNDDNSSAELFYYYKENDYNDNNFFDTSKMYKSTYNGILEKEIIEELKTLGFTFKFATGNDGRYYALVGIKEELLEGLK